jgi:diketogulonate reductase-like aldo/keto reductase
LDISTNKLQLADGNQMPQHGFGVYKITDDQNFTDSIKAAYDSGYRLFDTAQMYENEQLLGHALQKLKIDRSSIFLTTKVGEANQGYDQAIASVKESLQKLQTDYVDLLLVHWPVYNHFFETWRAFEDMKKQGLAKSIGVSNYTLAHLELLATKANEMPVVNQIEVNPHFSQKLLISYHNDHHIVTQAWSPLGRGKTLNDEKLIDLAKAKNKSVAQIILRWHLQNGISFIPKSTHPTRIAENAAIYDFELSAAEMQIVDSANLNKRSSTQEPELVYEFGQQYPH